MLSGIRILSQKISAIHSGILSGISSGNLCGWGPAGSTLIIKFDVFVVVAGVVAVAVAVVCCCCCCCCCCCRCYSCNFFLSPAVAEKRRRGGVFTFVWNSRSKKHRKYLCFLCLGSPEKHGIYDVFLPLVTNIMVFTMFFGPGQAKTLVFTQFSACCKKYFVHAKGTKTL